MTKFGTPSTFPANIVHLPLKLLNCYFILKWLKTLSTKTHKGLDTIKGLYCHFICTNQCKLIFFKGLKSSHTKPREQAKEGEYNSKKSTHTLQIATNRSQPVSQEKSSPLLEKVHIYQNTLNHCTREIGSRSITNSQNMLRLITINTSN